MTRKTYYQKGRPVGYEWKKKPSRDTGEAIVLGTFFVALVAVTLVYWNHIKNMNNSGLILNNNKNMRGEIDMATCVGTPRRRYYLIDKKNQSNLNDVMCPSTHCKSFKEKIIYA